MKSVLEYDPWLAAPLVKEFEGLELKAYKCPAGVWTIGYGHARGVKPTDSITLEQAESILRKDLQEAQNELNILCKVPLTKGQFIALISFVFNLGISKLRDKTIFRKLNNGDYKGASNEFPKWVYSGQKIIDGLVERRAKEKAIFDS